MRAGPRMEGVCGWEAGGDAVLEGVAAHRWEAASVMEMGASAGCNLFIVRGSSRPEHHAARLVTPRLSIRYAAISGTKYKGGQGEALPDVRC